jgi:DNA repair protein RadA/Sms
MSKVRSVFRCQGCGAGSPKWVGRCPACGEWNTLVEELDAVEAVPAVPERDWRPARHISEVAFEEWTSVPSGSAELDRVLGGGLVPGSVTLLGGEPGIGKSTLLLQVASEVAKTGMRALYVSAEESPHQVRRRAQRLGALAPRLFLANETAVSSVVAQLDEIDPGLVIVDSIQAVHDSEVGATAGSVAQVRAVAARLVAEAKRRDVTMVLVGHVTKDGALAGPRVLEHMVDTVLSFEGDRHHSLRLLRATKHRFGPVDELGVFEMVGDGLSAVPDASGLFLADRRPGVAGSVVVPTVDGVRPLLVEVQGLVLETKAPAPRRSAQGVDAGRLPMLLAVLARRAHIDLAPRDVYALAVGGAQLREPGVDLAVVLALVSSAFDHPLPDDVVVCGEVGLGGELRQVSHCARRLAEAARLGFRRAIVPRLSPDPPPRLELLRAATVAEAVELAGLIDPEPFEVRHPWLFADPP